ncbi:Eco57I restriction-modification methylase domain-containing protein [Actinomyces israelii]|uniref:Eco57I restriction-modification methylase domain-containing protein n=1 Tax=Actinomyces israelii TaxID=1659 RepID=UPI002356856B|nr:DNA methyltransferase [Actinomyces israelii]
MSRTTSKATGAKGPRGRSRGRGPGAAGGRTSAAQSHREWLTLVDREGPFLAVPPLARLYSTGIPAISPGAKEALRDAKPAFDRAWDAWRATEATENEGAARSEHQNRPEDRPLTAYRQARDAWVGTVLHDVLGWGAYWRPAPDPALQACAATSPNEAVHVEPDGALMVEGRVGALVLVVDPVGSLRDPLTDGWSASPVDRMEEMLRAGQASGAQGACSIGVVTDGRWWAIVSAPPGAMAASGIVDAQTWIEEPATRNAFVELLSIRRLLGGKAEERLPALFKASVLAAEEITVALGVQVRRAVELLVTAFSEAGRAARAKGEPDPLPDDPAEAYDAAVTVMMRVVFLLFAQERGLLPDSELFKTSYGLTGVLEGLEERVQVEGEESLDATSATWHRLLATSGALARGVAFEDLRLPAYGGSLFEPGRFPFLSATTERGTLRVTVPDRVMLHVLRAVQVARARGQEARRISFRDIDVEQIGYIYEGLLGYTARRATGTIVGLVGSQGDEPEIPLDVLDDLAEEHAGDAALAAAILAWVKEHQPSSTPPTKGALAKALTAGDSMEDAERSLLAVSRDEDVRDRLRPWIGAIRRDLRGRPTVVLPGGLYVAETPSRKNAGAHYTPRSLAEEVVRHALEPLVFRPGPYQSADRETWRPLPAADVLDLKVADIACGSGAFLVAAARFLADRLMEAWEQDGTAERFLASGRGPQELESRALREVVAHCLYGADINPMAVEMCKLSLWLVSLDTRLPFSFVDDKILTGNSLLGITDIRQLEELHIDPASRRRGQGGLLDVDARGQWGLPVDIEGMLRRIAVKRRDLSTPVEPGDPMRDTKAKDATYAGIQRELEPLKELADAVIAAGLDAGGRSGKKREEAYESLRVAVSRAYPAEGEADTSMLEAILERGLAPTVPTDYEHWHCIHWPLELPDVIQDHGGFDAIIGNPPFLGGQKLTGAMGANIRDWFVSVLANGTRGSADLVAYFFLRAHSLLKPTGTLGLIATNTLAQGDTRQVGLDRMVERGFTITRSIQSRPWPATSANLEYAAVWGTRGAVSDGVLLTCDDEQVARISTLLEPLGSVEGAPERLRENAGIAFIGCYVLGKGFIVEPEEAEVWIAADSRNADVLFPYLNGEDLNSRPDASASRWVIDFGLRSEREAGRYSLPFERVLAVVKPQRDQVKIEYRKKYWWRFAAWAPAMRKAIADLDEVLALARVSKTVMPLRVPMGQVFSEQVVVFASDSYALQSVLSSSLHQMWVITRGSTLETRVRYTPTDVFETFPRPYLTEESERVLEAIGKTLDEERREIMLRRELGLTKLYNRVNDPALADGADPDVARLRVIHRELDEAVMAAYGWDDVPLDHGFHTYRKMTRWTISPAARVEVLDRLLALNHERAAAQERRQGRKGEPS